MEKPKTVQETGSQKPVFLKTRKFRITVAVVAIILLIPLLTTVALNYTHVGDRVSAYVQSSLGREFSIDGRLGASWGWSPVFFAEDIKLANSDWGTSPWAFTAERVAISLSFSTLLQGKLQITAIELEQPNLWVERDPQSGKFNLEFDSTGSVSSRSGLVPQWLRVEKIALEGGNILYRGPESDWAFGLDRVSMESAREGRHTNVEIRGDIEGTALVLAGTLGSTEAILGSMETAVDLDGYLKTPENRFSLSGVIQDLPNWHGVNLWVEAELPDLTDFSDMTGFSLPPLRNISAAWELVQPERISTLSMELLKLSALYHGLETSIEGEIKQLTRLDGVSLKFATTGAFRPNLVFPEAPESLAWDVALGGLLYGGRENMAVEVLKGDLQGPGLAGRISGKVERVGGDWSHPLSIAMSTDNLQTVADSVGLDFPGTPSMEVSAGLMREDSAFRLVDITAFAKSEDLGFSASGYLDHLVGRREGKFQFETTASDRFIRRFGGGKAVQLMDAYQATGVMTVSGSVIALPELEITGGGKGIGLTGSGSIDGLFPLTSARLDSTVEFDSLKKLETWLDHGLPATAPGRVSATLQSTEQGGWMLRDISGGVNDPDLSVSIRGHTGTLQENPDVDVNLEWRFNSLRPIAAVVENFPESMVPARFFPLTGQARFHRNNEEADGPGYALSEISMQNLSGDLRGKVSGRLDRLFADSGSRPVLPEGTLAVDVHGKLARDMPVNTGVPWVQVLKSGDLDASMNVRFSQHGIGFEHINFVLDAPESRVAATGSVARISPFRSNGLNLEWETDSLPSLLQYPDGPRLRDQAAKGSVTVRGTDAATLLDVEMVVASSDLSGEIRIDHAGGDSAEKPRQAIKANLASRRMDLTEILDSDEDEPKFFSDEDLGLDWINHVEALVRYEADGFRNDLFSFGKLTADTTVSQGKLDLNLVGHSAQGPLEVYLGLAKPQDRVDMLMFVAGDRVGLSSLSPLGNSTNRTIGSSGEFNADLGFSGTGKSIAEIAGTLNGFALVEFSGVKIRNEGLDLFGKDLFRGFLDIIDLRTTSDAFLEAECGVIQFDIKDGVAQSQYGLAMKMKEITLLGGGRIDLKNEELDLIVTPKARKGFGINASSIAKMVKVGGQIGEPEIEADPKGLLQSGFAIGAALFSGGLSLLAQGLYDKMQANSDVCMVALEEGVDLMDKTVVLPDGSG
ncbi:MAG: AsmA family protein [Gammaproteobacteria bacterium]|nr:AsmA family protein [Gammaproteobacteria bacterium]